MHSVVAKGWRGVPLGMHQMNLEYFDDDPSYNSVPADVLLLGKSQKKKRTKRNTTTRKMTMGTKATRSERDLPLDK
jgi:hypothetical protein